LLPGLEEEASEDFERTLQLLEDFRQTVKDTDWEFQGKTDVEKDGYFWQCFFLASITSSSRRLGALAFLTRKLPTIGEPISQQPPSKSNTPPQAIIPSPHISAAAKAVVSPEPGLLIRCFAAGLADDQLLIQRGFLDLLVSHLPLHASILQKTVP